MKIANGAINCKSCGAPVTTEICPYCGERTGIETVEADMNYPLLECKSVNIDSVVVSFSFVFFVSFFGCGLALVIEALRSEMMLIMASILCLIIGAIAGYLFIGSIVRYVMVKTRGTCIQATVYGYVNDRVMTNGMPNRMVKLLIQTPRGPRYIMYHLKNVQQPYEVNTQIELLAYKNYFLIDNSKK